MTPISDLGHEPLRILLVGNGGREHALAWKLDQSPLVEQIFVVPGNGGTAAGLSKVSNVTDVAADDYPGLVGLAKKLGINLVVPGPEVPIVDGIEGYFRAANIACFGPTKEAAKLEGSKAFSKDFMQRHNIPTATYCNFNDHDSARQYVNTVSHPIVIKASGLAAGKGVIIPRSKDEALVALKEVMLDRKFGDAGKDVVIEEFLEGDELSILTFSDGTSFKSMPPAQDHKRIYDEDKGPNTGGMGCYAPAKISSPSLLDEIDKTILEPTFNGLRQEGTPFAGLLFTGLMITPSGPKVLEYNVRFGDPETQTLLPLLSPTTDLAEIMTACTTHRLEQLSIQIEPKSCVTVVAASGGYPGSYPQGYEIHIDDQAPRSGINIFHAGTKKLPDNGTLVTSGGRVLAISATADTLSQAVDEAYAGMSTVHFKDMFYRRDIARRLV